tara:strand:+ start:1310 stop:2347 length:1038 start_codon:yes stop_codon:yes gene_type:complete
MKNIVCFLFFVSFTSIAAIEDHKIYPIYETEAVKTSGDAADDPAFWLNKTNPEKSIVFGTDKKSGIYTYDLSGKTLDYFPMGRINNIDLRSDYIIQDRTVSLLAGTNRDLNRVDFLLIGSDGSVNEYYDNFYETELTSVYGLCLFKDPEDSKTFIFVTDEISLAIYQYEIQSYAPMSAKLVRTIPTQSVSEGCVVDDDLKILYFSQEDEKSGIFKTTAMPEGGNIETIDLIKPSGNITGDSEGLALVKLPDQTLLISSSQDSNEYLIYTTGTENQYLGKFTIATSTIDGTSETDGIEAFYGSLNPQFPLGIFIAQDDVNLDQYGDPINQNFKFSSLKDAIDPFIK